MMRHFVATLPPSQLRGATQRQDTSGDGAGKTDKSKAGFFEGLRIIATRPYVLGIMLVSTLYEVISTIVDYQLKVMAHNTPDYSTAEVKKNKRYH